MFRSRKFLETESASQERVAFPCNAHVVLGKEISRMSAGVECALFRVEADDDIESAAAKVFFGWKEDPDRPPHDDLNIGRAPLDAAQQAAEEEGGAKPLDFLFVPLYAETRT